MNNSNQIETEELNIKEIISFLFKHKSLIILATFISFIISFYYTITVTPKYKAFTTLMIKESDSASSSSVLFDLIGDGNVTQIENEKLLIKSRVISEDVIKELWRSNHRDNLHILGTRNYVPRAQSERALLTKIFSLGYYNYNQVEENSLDSIYNDYSVRIFAEDLIDNLEVSNKKNTDIITIAYTSPFADESALILNQISKSYILMDKDWSLNQANSILSFVESQSLKIEKDLSISEEKLKAFKENEGIFDLSGNSELLLTQIIDAESKYYNTNAELSIAEERQKYLSSTLSEEEKTFANKLLNSINPKLLALRTEISEKEVELVRISTLHGDSHATVTKLSKEVEALKNKLDLQAKSMIKQGLVVADPVEYRQELISNLLVVESQIADLSAKSIQYKKLVEMYNEQLEVLPSLQLGYARLERDRKVLNSTYMLMREKLEESRIQVASVTGKVQVIDKAIPPMSKISPNHKINLLIGLFIGLLIGSGISGMIEFFDNTIKSLDQIDSKYTVLGVIPAIKSETNQKFNLKFIYLHFKKQYQHYMNLFFNMSIKKNNFEIRHLITHDNPKSPISEAYRSIRTSLSFSFRQDKKFHSMLISSTGPGEGKTTTITNLAITYANLGKKVLLIDADLRRPIIHKIFNFPNDSGLTSFLSGSITDIETIKNKSDIKNLDIITSGIIPPNPSELLGSEKMIELIDVLKDKWDIVLFDSPPLVAVTDASLMSKYLDKMVLVVMPGKTDKKAFSHCTKNLKDMNIDIEGIIFNGVDTKNSYGSYYYYYQYYDYYGKS